MDTGTCTDKYMVMCVCSVWCVCVVCMVCGVWWCVVVVYAEIMSSTEVGGLHILLLSAVVASYGEIPLATIIPISFIPAAVLTSLSSEDDDEMCLN